jgi:hypothetical protein
MSKQHKRRLNVLSWVSPFVALALIAFLFTSSIGRASLRTVTRGVTGQPLICTVSSFYSIDTNEQTPGSIRIEGRGLATCKNDQGVSNEIPVSSVITARAVGNWANAGELTFSANSASFAIPRDLTQMQDVYEIKRYASDLNDRSAPMALFSGTQQGLVIEMRFTSTTQALSKIELTSMALHFDESAPTLD